jgi:hypothetical protein
MEPNKNDLLKERSRMVLFDVFLLLERVSERVVKLNRRRGRSILGLFHEDLGGVVGVNEGLVPEVTVPHVTVHP